MTSQHLTAADYVHENFALEDRVALLALHRATNSVMQRITTAETLASPPFQAWLRYLNGQKHDLYLSMNTLKRGSRGRTKEDVDRIRHVFLDFDENGDRLLQALLARTDLPVPNYVVSTSPDKWQVIWKVEGFQKAAAEELERGLVRSTGADPCVIDVARVLRLPGFYNHKYSPAHLVSADARSGVTRHPGDFPTLAVEEPLAPYWPPFRSSNPPSRTSQIRSQSERDWAFAHRALARGESESSVTEEMTRFRSGQKYDAHDYAQRTVRKVLSRLEQTTGSHATQGDEEKQR
jgi:hypothetical protein